MSDSKLKQGNLAFQSGNYVKALWLYREAVAQNSFLGKFLNPLIDISVKRAIREVPLTLPKVSEIDTSIIVPVFNKLEYTLQCIRAIKEYTDPCYELIVVDDCSTDFTAETLKKIENLVYIRNTENIGFLLSCNEGLKRARGKNILFLNNDTEVTPGWLEPMRSALEKPDVGIVGAKLLYPDGSLQEAGCIYWHDARGNNCGRGDPIADKGEYNFLREVDKCSGAALLVRGGLIRNIGGFDPRFAPAYKEDADLCFEVRERGFKVIYQPRSTIIHYEGVSCGTNITTGIKRFQEMNRPKFVEKWGRVLRESHYENRRENVFLARSRPNKAKYFLVIDDKLPEFDRHAGGLGMYQYLLLLSELGFRVIFYPDNRKRTQPYATILEDHGIELKYEVSTALFKDWLKSYGKFIDYVWLSRPNESAKYIDTLRQHSSARILYCGRDVHHLRYQRKYEIERSEESLLKARALRETELSLYAKVDQILLFSDVEVQYLRSLGIPPKKINLIPAYYYNVDGQFEPEGRKDIVFLGGFKHHPNVDAVLWFSRECMPLIASVLPDTKLLVVGPDPTDDVISLGSGSIEVMGYVEDLSPVFERSRLMIAPIRYGAGVKGKIVNGMANGLPVVATVQGLEGMGLNPGVNCLEANSPGEFARQIQAVFERDELWRLLSSGGLSYIDQRYSKQYAKDNLLALLNELK